MTLLASGSGFGGFTDPPRGSAGDQSGTASTRVHPAGGGVDARTSPTAPRERATRLFIAMPCRASGRRLLTRPVPDQTTLHAACLPAAGSPGRADPARPSAFPCALTRAGARAARIASCTSEWGREDGTAHDPGRCVISALRGGNAEEAGRGDPPGVRQTAKCPRSGSRPGRRRGPEVQW